MGADRQIARDIYPLKRQRGAPAVIQRESITTNVSTGETVTEITASTSIRRVVILPKNIELVYLPSRDD